MEIKWLKTFIVAAKHENFRQASEELFLTQPAVTKHIKRLEDSLNMQLFERIGKQVVLTPAGYKFHSYAQEIVTNFEQGVKEFESWKQGYNKKLVIATAPQIASSILPSILRKFMDKYPEIEVLVKVLKSYEIGEEISSGKADVGLTRIVPIQTNLYVHAVHEEPVILVAPNENVNVSNNEVTNYNVSAHNERAILGKYRIITHNHPDYWDHLVDEIRRFYPTVRTIRVDQVEVTKRFIEEGLGVSYLPVTVVKEELALCKLIEIKPSHIIPPTSTTYVITKVETNEVSLFIAFLKDALIE